MARLRTRWGLRPWPLGSRTAPHLALCVALALTLQLAAASRVRGADAPAELHAFDVEASAAGAIVTLRVRGPVSYESLSLSNPSRFVLDLQNVRLGARSKRHLDPAHGITAVRASQYKPNVTRVVLDLVGGAKTSVAPVPEGLRVRVSLSRPPASSAAPARAETATRTDARADTGSPEPTTNARAVPAATQPSKTSAPPASRPAAAPSIASITYITPSSIYIDAGSGDRLQLGDRVEVLRSGKPVAQLGVEHISSRKAACRVIETGVELRVGDTVQFFPSANPEAPVEDTSGLVTAASPAAAPSRRSRSSAGWLRDNGIRGRIGARYLTVVDRGGTGQSFSQPAMDLRIDGKSIGGSSLDLDLDVRARQTYRTSSDGSTSNDGRSRVYQAAGTWHPGDSWFHLTLGRQYSPDLPTLSIFDGAAATLRFSHWSLGILSGTQPDPLDYGYSSEVRDSGGFLQISSSRAPADLWYVTVGFIGSYVAGEINREFVTLQASYAQPRFSAYVSQDVDLNRGWRREIEGSDHTFTNTYLSSRWRPTQSLSLHAGYDNRRNVRLYRDFESPETEFDDAHRQGFWGGFSQRFARIGRVGFDAKRATGGASGDADAFTFTVGAQWRLHANLRSTYFTNQLADGWMHTGLLGAQLLPWVHAEIGGGMRDESSNVGLTQQGTLRWMHFGLDTSLGRHWYMALSLERSKEGIEASDQAYLSTNYRF